MGGYGAYIFPAAIVIIVGWGISLYNRLVTAKQRVSEGWSGVDVQLRRRSNLIPNLVDLVRGYMEHERAALESVTKLRQRSAEAESEGDETGRAQAEGQLSGSLLHLFAVAENYPDLKANQNFLKAYPSIFMSIGTFVTVFGVGLSHMVFESSVYGATNWQNLLWILTVRRTPTPPEPSAPYTASTITIVPPTLPGTNPHCMVLHDPPCVQLRLGMPASAPIQTSLYPRQLGDILRRGIHLHDRRERRRV